MATKPPGRSRFFWPLCAGVALYVGVEKAVFRERVYGRIVTPVSSTGMVSDAVRGNAPARDGRREVLIVGDSRMAEGISVRSADGLPAGRDLRLCLAAVPGTVLRIWRYLIRELDPHGDRFAAIVIPTLGYDDVDYGEYGGLDPAQRVYDLRFLAPLVRTTDLDELVRSFAGLDERVQAVRGVLLRGFAYKHDFQSLLLSPFERIRLLQRLASADARLAYDYDGHAETLAGVAWDPERKELRLAPEVAPGLAGLLRAQAAAPLPARSADIAGYRRYWLERILDDHAGGSTRVVAFPLPRGALRTPRVPPDPTSVLRTLAAGGRITLLPEDLCAGLERPETFYDGVHVNREGRRLLTQLLCDELVRLLR